LQQNCAPCHGAAGDGNGAAASTLIPEPANFRLKKPDIDYILRLGDGIPGTGMHAWKAQISEADQGRLPILYGRCSEAIPEETLKSYCIVTLCSFLVVALNSDRRISELASSAQNRISPEIPTGKLSFAGKAESARGIRPAARRVSIQWRIPL
jgi:hypothetical protein